MGFFRSMGSCCPPRERAKVCARERKRAHALATAAHHKEMATDPLAGIDPSRMYTVDCVF